jgi:integrase
MARKAGIDRGVLFRQGRWWVRVYVNGREKWYSADTKTQAKALYGRIKAEVRENRYFPEKYARHSDITVRGWIKRFLDGITSPGLRNMFHYGRFWSKLLGPLLLSEVSAQTLRQIQARMLAKDTRNPQTINRYFAALRRMLNLAILEGHLASNPVKGVKFFPEPAGRLRFLSDTEIERLRESAVPEHWNCIAFALNTGLRLTEQFQARWDCVDVDRGILTIPLSKGGRTRHVILNEPALAIIRSLSSCMYSPFLFPSPKTPSKALQGRNFVVRVYEPALRQAGIVGANWHTLRHTFASRAVMAGVDIRTVQELMGHSTITMTMRYAHLSPAHLRAAVNKASVSNEHVKRRLETVSKTVSVEEARSIKNSEPLLEVYESTHNFVGGAERVRTAASQFCRLLP